VLSWLIFTPRELQRLFDVIVIVAYEETFDGYKKGENEIKLTINKSLQKILTTSFGELGEHYIK